MKKFNMIDENFKCEYCESIVEKLNYSARDHCPFCLYSKHVDIMPGDRLCTCHGLLEPVGIEKFKNTFKILYRCKKCGLSHKNVVANDDNYDLIVKLSVQK